MSPDPLHTFNRFSTIPLLTLSIPSKPYTNLLEAFHKALQTLSRPSTTSTPSTAPLGWPGRGQVSSSGGSGASETPYGSSTALYIPSTDSLQFALQLPYRLSTYRQPSTDLLKAFRKALQTLCRPSTTSTASTALQPLHSTTLYNTPQMQSLRNKRFWADS